MVTSTGLLLSTLQLLACMGWLSGDGKSICIEPPPPPEQQVVSEVSDQASDSLAALQHQIDAILDIPLLSTANVGVYIVSLKDGKTLYERNSRKLYQPASTMKIVTAAAALAKLGPDFHFTTRLYADEENPIHNLYLKGGGDPLFSTEDLTQMVSELKQQGVEEVTGDIVVDESYHDSVRKGRGWMWDDGPFGGFYSELSALSINHNGVRVSVGPSSVGQAVHVGTQPTTDYINVLNRARTTRSGGNLDIDIYTDNSEEIPKSTITVQGSMRRNQGYISQHVDIKQPALYAGTLLKEQLIQAGIGVAGEVVYGRVPEDAKLLVEHSSPPLSAIIAEMNKSSDNLTAELVLKNLGAETQGVPGTANKGVQAIREFLQNDVGINPNLYSLADGSGVSRYNLVTARMLTSVLVYMYNDLALMPDFFNSLAVAGVDGTLKHRMRSGPNKGVLRAKTGTMQNVSTLTGYTTTADNEFVAFAILVNNHPGSPRPIRLLQDKIGNALATFSRDDHHDENDVVEMTDTSQE